MDACYTINPTDGKDAADYTRGRAEYAKNSALTHESVCGREYAKS